MQQLVPLAIMRASKSFPTAFVRAGKRLFVAVGALVACSRSDEAERASRSEVSGGEEESETTRRTFEVVTAREGLSA